MGELAAKYSVADYSMADTNFPRPTVRRLLERVGRVGRAATVLCIVACGRISFQPLADPDAASLPVCDEDDFSDGDANGWSDDNGGWMIATGPTGTMWQTQDPGTKSTYRVPVVVYDEIDFAVDIMVSNLAFGDAFVEVADGADRVYRAMLHPSGSDDPVDQLERVDQPTVVLDTAPNRLSGTVGEWSRVRVVRRSDSLQVFVDGVAHLSGFDAAYGPGHYAIVGFNGGGAIGNVSLRCR